MTTTDDTNGSAPYEHHDDRTVEMRVPQPLADIRDRIFAACDSLQGTQVDGKLVRIVAMGGDLAWDQGGGPFTLAGTDVSPLAAVLVAEKVAPPLISGQLLDILCLALGVDSDWVMWFIVGCGGDDRSPPAASLEPFNLGRETRARYVK